LFGRISEARDLKDVPKGSLKAPRVADGRTPAGLSPLTRVSTEMSLHVLAYNLKRVIAILGGVVGI